MDGVIFRTTDSGRWGAAGGSGTGGNLTQTQFDENNWELLTRVQALENDPPLAVSIDHFTVIGSQFMIYMTDATSRGPFDLPIATFRDVGIWVNDLPLLVLDFFEVIHRGFYRTLIAHTTPHTGEFNPDAVDEDSGHATFGDPLYQLVFGEDVYIYDIGFFMPGTPGVGIDDGGEMFAHALDRNVQLPANLEGSICRIKTACTAAISMPIKHNGTTVGTANIAIGQTEGTFTFTTDVDFIGGTDTLAVLKPTTGIDATAKGLKITFRAIRTDL